MYVFCPSHFTKDSGLHLLGYYASNDLVIVGRFDEKRIRELTAKHDNLVKIGILKSEDLDMTSFVKETK